MSASVAIDLLAAALRTSLMAVPSAARPTGDAAALIVDVLLEAGKRAWIGRVPRVPHATAAELPEADPVYRTLYNAWVVALPGYLAVRDAEIHVIVCSLLHVVRETVGGEYVTVGRQDTALRDERIYRDFRGDYRSLAIREGLTETRVRQIVNERHKHEVSSRQGSLF